MRFFGLTAVMMLSAVSLASSISDASVGLNTKLAKRSEGFHFVTCAPTENTEYHLILHCDNDGNCNENPGKGEGCTVPFLRLEVVWEKNLQHCTFPGTPGTPGYEFGWSITKKAATQPNYSLVGNANDGTRNFDVYKDDDHVMYTDGRYSACHSNYYSIPD